MCKYTLDRYSMTSSLTQAVCRIYLSLISTWMHCPQKSFSSTSKQLIILLEALGAFTMMTAKRLICLLHPRSRASPLFPPIRLRSRLLPSCLVSLQQPLLSSSLRSQPRKFCLQKQPPGGGLSILIHQNVPCTRNWNPGFAFDTSM